MRAVSYLNNQGEMVALSDLKNKCLKFVPEKYGYKIDSLSWYTMLFQTDIGKFWQAIALALFPLNL